MNSKIITDIEKLGGNCDVVDVTKNGEAVRGVIVELKDIIKEDNLKCLTAPQIGINMRIVVMNYSGNMITYCNPAYYPRNVNKMVMCYEETCPCLPGKTYIRPRYDEIEVIYTTPLGEARREMLVGESAVVFEYAVDHLDGLLLCDVGLEIDDEYRNAPEEEKVELIKWYKDKCLDEHKEIMLGIREDETLSKTYDAIDFMEKVKSGEVTLKQSEDTVKVAPHIKKKSHRK